MRFFPITKVVLVGDTFSRQCVHLSVCLSVCLSVAVCVPLSLAPLAPPGCSQRGSEARERTMGRCDGTLLLLLLLWLAVRRIALWLLRRVLLLWRQRRVQRARRLAHCAVLSADAEKKGEKHQNQTHPPNDFPF